MCITVGHTQQIIMSEVQMDLQEQLAKGLRAEDRPVFIVTREMRR